MVTSETEWRDGFRFAGGHPALDLCATIRGRLKEKPSDTLQTPEDLGRWLAASGLAGTPPVVADPDLETARQLREAVYALALAATAGELLPPRPLAVLNDLASGPAASLALGADRSATLEGDARSFVGHVAGEAVRLLADRHGGVIRQCDGEGCAVLFHDQSRARARRWCSMSVCGNRAKAAAFRERDRRG